MTVPEGLPNLIQQGLALQQRGQLAEAEACYRSVLERDPNRVEANHLLGVLKAQEGKTDEALRYIEVALKQAPTSALVLMDYGNILSAVGRYAEALICFDQALAINPQMPSAWSNRGNALKRLWRYDEAVASHERAITLGPNDADAHYNLGLSLYHQGQNDRSSSCFNHALELKPGFVRASVARCMSELPVLYRDEPEIERRRCAYRVHLQALTHVADRDPQEFVNAIDATPPFFLPYQGRNDRDLQSLYGTILCRAMARVVPSAEHSADPAAPGERVRVGIVSGFFRAHSNWKIPVKGWVSQIDRQRVQLFGYHTGIDLDAETDVARGMFERFVQGPMPLDAWREAILADRLHVLIYPEIGMDPRCLQLAAQRLAPVQCNSWGHPTTSGFPTIDYYLSSDLMEPTDAEGHYTEELVRLPNLSIYYEPPVSAQVPISRGEIGLRSAVPAYWCGQSLYKYLPQNDEVFARIAREVGACQFVFIEYPGQEANALFRRRMNKGHLEK
jgi:protein O-GlcNAc transferase